MASKVAVVIIHGMGSQEESFADAAMDEINGWIAGKGKNPHNIVWKSIYWADITEPRQRTFMTDIVKHPDNDIDYVKLRRFIVSAIGDAAAYQNIRGKQTSTYSQIHKHVRSCIKDLYDNELGRQPVPLIVMAHSLGGHIMSCYIWDIQKIPDPSLSEFENMKYLAGVITFGCNIPLFAFSHTKLEPFSFPGDKLTTAQKSKARWHNFYDPDDVLGYPLRQIGDEYKFIKDHHINAGGLLTSWNPLSHKGYWTDNDFTKQAAKYIAKFL